MEGTTMAGRLTSPLYLNVRKHPVVCKAGVRPKAALNPHIGHQTLSSRHAALEPTRRIRPPPRGCVKSNVKPS
jgi:hypothetical protein